MTLGFLRLVKGWTGQRLATEAPADVSTISRYENGRLKLEEDKLLQLGGVMGYTPNEVRLVLAIVEQLLEQPEAPAHPLAPGSAEQRELAAQGDTFLLRLRPVIQQAVRDGWARDRAEQDRRRALALVGQLEELGPAERRGRIESDPACLSWALVPELGERSVRALAHSVPEGEEWAELARLAAERVDVPPSWRRRLRACALFFTANVRRVGNRLQESRDLFAKAWPEWRGTRAVGLPLEEWRYLNLEASLLCDLRQADAVVLIERCIEMAPAEAVPGLQVMLGSFLNEIGDAALALPVLEAARELIEAGGNLRLCCALQYTFATTFLELGRIKEAKDSVRGAQALAREGKNDLDALRADGLAAKVDLALGRLGSARCSFSEVRHGFTARGLALDAALTTLEEILGLLQAGESGEVRELAEETFWIFHSGQLPAEALASLQVFLDAARRDEATVELVRQTLGTLGQARKGSGPQAAV